MGQENNTETLAKCLSATLAILVDKGIILKADINDSFKKQGYKGLYDLLNEVGTETE